MELFNRYLRPLLFAVAAAAACAFNAAAQVPPGPGPLLTDERDGKTYKTAGIGGRAWMAENLNYKTDKSWCYDDDESNCKKYGRLYTWEAAMAGCPSGWRLPTADEWKMFVGFVGGEKAGQKLKSADGWGSSGKGTDDYGFSALPGGYRTQDERFASGDYGARWWTATESTYKTADYRYISGSGGEIYLNGYSKSGGLSVRCVRK
jgi:uncharacterized protein (TIGR02145 family)